MTRLQNGESSCVKARARADLCPITWKGLALTGGGGIALVGYALARFTDFRVSLTGLKFQSEVHTENRQKRNGGAGLPELALMDPTHAMKRMRCELSPWSDIPVAANVAAG